ncbi:hypothetical protein A1O1_08249 [Capronia coronata CBS 617.96]|uniref:Zn(2)-C6 fungal-type domain-containing protein n=1 Tax=Capronia coronata CBS 617.96 TaxID=1182541 RepID=W9XXT1_9EURO|nr:uncharacterized protein A1O1_08249 [Capronia coronata CBS 617.96]EXJ82180.1 hypothetical protein A1O1_08249 [Capronia coronata CBS 617.96]
MSLMGDEMENNVSSATDLQLDPSSDNTRPPPGARKRGRNASACLQCHTRKQKCNGHLPCLNCIRRGVGYLCSGPPAQHQREPRSREKRTQEPKRRAPEARSQSPAPDEVETTGNSGQAQIPPVPTESQPRIGQLWRSRGAPAFFGTSYFGPQVAAIMIDSSAPDIPAGTGSSRAIDARPFRDESGPFSQIWDLLGLLPRRKTAVDHLVDRFFNDVNQDIDAVHPTSFRQSYVQFWERKSGFDDVTTVDLRWLALLFIILAIGTYLDCPLDSTPETKRDYEEASLRFYWASRRAIVLAPSFYGESTDLVRAGVLVTRYLIQTQRLAESWLTVGFAARIGIAQGLHVDGDKWGLPRRSTETRRRLWCHLYTLDRMISLALGRPSVISDAQSIMEEPQNIFVDDLTDDEARSAQPQPLTNPTISAMASFEYRLAKVIGQIQEACFHFHSVSYRDVLALDEKLMRWKSTLPPYFALEDPNLSLDETHGYLKWQRLYLHTSFHFARITLHRPFLLRYSMTNRYESSRHACLSSARADLGSRLNNHTSVAAERYASSLAAHQLFNSAIILGIIAVREAKSQQTPGVVEDLEAYCEMQRSEMWLSEFGLAEIKVVEMCIAKLKQQLQGSAHRGTATQQQSPQAARVPTVADSSNVAPTDIGLTLTADQNSELMNVGGLEMVSPSTLNTGATSVWQDQLFPGSFPGLTDLQTWQEVIDSIDVDFRYDG